MPENHFLQIDQLSVHVQTCGAGQPAFLLLHGFAANLDSWEAVMGPLSRHGQVIAFDRPAFGQTERPLNWKGQNPYCFDAQVELARQLLDAYNVPRAILMGHSAGGALALQLALQYPERVQALVLVDAAIFSGGGPPGWAQPLLGLPPIRWLGLRMIRQAGKRLPKLLELAWHDPQRLTPEIVSQYTRPLKLENWDRALWEFTRANQAPKLAGCLAQVRMPVLVVSGDDDRIVPPAESTRLAQELPDASRAIIPEAGHVPHEEQPEAFLQAVEAFLERLPVG